MAVTNVQQTDVKSYVVGQIRVKIAGFIVTVPAKSNAVKQILVVIVHFIFMAVYQL